MEQTAPISETFPQQFALRTARLRSQRPLRYTWLHCGAVAPCPTQGGTLMKNTQLLLINDMCGYGKVALSAMLPVLSHMGYRIHNLPTALVSDTLNYPKFYIHDTTEYVRQSLAIWEELGFEFDAISTGFIVTEEETRIISDFCHRRAQKGTKVFVDPIMGDNGKLYAGVPESTIGLMRHLLECADYAVPNYTEACLLTDTPIAERITPDEARALVDAVRELGAKSVVITSAVVNGTNAVIGYDHVAGEYFTIPFELIPGYGRYVLGRAYGSRDERLDASARHGRCHARGGRAYRAQCCAGG